MKCFEKNWVEIEQHIQTCYHLKEKGLATVKFVNSREYFKILKLKKGLKTINLL